MSCWRKQKDRIEDAIELTVIALKFTTRFSEKIKPNKRGFSVQKAAHGKAIFLSLQFFARVTPSGKSRRQSIRE